MLKRPLMPALLLCIFLPCCLPKAGKIRKPEPERFQETIPLEENQLAFEASFARASDFSRILKGVRCVSIRYSSPVSAAGGGGNSPGPWEREIEQNLLRKGFTVRNEPPRQEIIPDEEEDLPEADACLIVDTLLFSRFDTRKRIALKKAGGETADYPYHYYRSEIGAKLVLREKRIVWSGHIRSNSLAYLFREKKVRPCLDLRGVRDSRYSEKLGQWMKNGWEIRMEDNFLQNYSPAPRDEAHRADLIRHITALLFEGMTP